MVKDGLIDIIVDYLTVACIVCKHVTCQNNRIAPSFEGVIGELNR